jgi:peptidoglycan/xylan/chitin deacetylase (PgdA/CDA1 family)
VSTAKVLDTLKAEKIKATFFVNTHNTTNLAASPAAQEALRRMYAEGHEVGNHSVHHYDLNKASVDVEAELAGVENAVHAIVPDAPRMSLVRTPFGNPFFGPVSRLHVLEPIIHKHGMHIGWQIDTNDWKCVSKGADCVTANLKEELAAGYHGILLMHSTHATSAAALPEVIRILRAEGFHFVSVEDLVKAKYGGKTSSQVLGR